MKKVVCIVDFISKCFFIFAPSALNYYCKKLLKSFCSSDFAAVMTGSLRFSIWIHRDRNKLFGNSLVQSRISLRQIHLILADRRHPLQRFILNLNLSLYFQFLLIRERLSFLFWPQLFKCLSHTIINK